MTPSASSPIRGKGQVQGANPAADLIVPLAGLEIDAFARELANLHANFAGVPKLLNRFRAGDENMIATERLSGPNEDPLALEVASNAFFDGLSETTRLLQVTATGALAATRVERTTLKADIDAFGEKFNGVIFTPYPVSIQGRPQGREQTLAHGRAAQPLNRRLAHSPALARLTLDALPRFAQRTGIDATREADKLDRFFATETANLILARVLLIRFLEDHGFFDVDTPDGSGMIPTHRQRSCRTRVGGLNRQGAAGFRNEIRRMLSLTLSGRGFRFAFNIHHFM